MSRSTTAVGGGVVEASRVHASQQRAAPSRANIAIHGWFPWYSEKFRAFRLGKFIGLVLRVLDAVLMLRRVSGSKRWFSEGFGVIRSRERSQRSRDARILPAAAANSRSEPAAAAKQELATSRTGKTHRFRWCRSVARCWGRGRQRWAEGSRNPR